MRSEPICAYVYINGEIIQSSSANAIFIGDNTKSLLLNPTMTLPNIITAIQSSITENGVTPIINALWYRCPVYQLNGEVQYRAIQTIDEEGVSCMFHTFLNMTSVICMELEVDVHNSLSPTQVNDLSWVDMEQKLKNTLKLE